MSTIYHVDLVKPYKYRPGFVNLLIDEESEVIEEAVILYSIADPNEFDF